MLNKFVQNVRILRQGVLSHLQRTGGWGWRKRGQPKIRLNKLIHARVWRCCVTFNQNIISRWRREFCIRFNPTEFTFFHLSQTEIYVCWVENGNNHVRVIENLCPNRIKYNIFSSKILRSCSHQRIVAALCVYAVWMLRLFADLNISYKHSLTDFSLFSAC